MGVEYLAYQARYKNDLSDMIKSLYDESPGGLLMTDEKIESTIDFLISHEEQGKITLLMEQGEAIGYSIIVYFWSNEYGGPILVIDELYIKAASRSKGIGTEFIKYLLETGRTKYKAVQLEVFPSNPKALELYERIGFQLTVNKFLRVKID